MLNRELIASLGFDVDEVITGVYQITNFVSPEELSALKTEAESRPEDDWNQYLNEMKKNAYAKFGHDDLKKLVEEGLLEVTDNFSDKIVFIQNTELMQQITNRASTIFDLVGDLDVTGFTTFQRLYEGTDLKQHFDQYSDKLVEYAAVLYLNDDYTAGEIFFPNFSRELKPAAGSLLIFPGTPKYEHGVRTVGAGPVRYVIPVFIKSRHPDGAMAGWANFG
jgi:hypothetical protein